MSVEESKATVRRWIEGFNKKNLDVMNQLFSANIKYRGPGQEVSGIEDYRKLVSTYLEALDGRITAEDMVAAGDTVATRFTFSGTHVGELMGVAGTGKPVKFSGMIFDRLEGGRIVEEYEEFDALGLMQQIGAIHPGT